MSLPVLAESLTKDFGSVRAVDDVSFEIAPGRVVGVLGPNGSGKTTVLRMLLGLVSPTAGRALIGGHRYVDLDHPARRVGAALEARAFDGGRSARDHLRVVATEARLPLDRVDDVLPMVGLADSADRRTKGFSLGMGQRLSLAAALIGSPDVLILDEPTNGLDPAGIRWLRELLREQAQSGRTVVVSSHALAEMQQTADEVLILHGGRLRGHLRMSEIDSLEDAFMELTGP